MQWQPHWACRHRCEISQEQMLSKCPGRGPRMIKMMRLEDYKSRRGRKRMRQLVGDDQRAEMRGRGKGVTANIATGIATAVEVAAGKGIASIGREIETMRANRLRAVTVEATGVGAAVGTKIIADDTGTTGRREAEATAGNVGGRRKMDTVEDLQTDEGVSVLNADGVIDKYRIPWRLRQLQEASRATSGGAY